MNIEAKASVAGVFKKIEVLDKNGKVKKQLDPFNNLITNIGLDRLKTTGSSALKDVYNICQAGTGNSLPNINDQSLDSFVAASSTTTYSGNIVNIDDGYVAREVTYTFALGSIDNQNISELSTAWSASPTNSIFSRALVLDALGNPTSITILSDEQLRVTWEIRYYWPTGDTVTVLENTGNKGGSYTVTVRPIEIGNWIAGAGQYHGIVWGDVRNGADRNRVGFYHGTYTLVDPSSPKVTTNLIHGNGAFSVSNVATSERKIRGRNSFGLSQGNYAGGIGGAYFLSGPTEQGAGWDDCSTFRFQAKIDPPIMKDADSLMSIDFSISWDRKVL